MAPHRLVMRVAGQVKEVAEEDCRVSVGQPEVERLQHLPLHGQQFVVGVRVKGEVQQLRGLAGKREDDMISSLQLT